MPGNVDRRLVHAGGMTHDADEAGALGIEQFAFVFRRPPDAVLIEEFGEPLVSEGHFLAGYHITGIPRIGNDLVNFR